MHRRDFLRTAAVGGSAACLFSTGGIGANSATDSYQPLGHVSIEDAKETVVGDDGNTAFVAATDGFVTVDIRNPENPHVLSERRGLLEKHDGGPLTEIWDVTVDGDRLLVVGPANPVASDEVHGTLLYDVSDPSNPKRVAFHETAFPIHNASLTDDIAYLTGNNGDGNPLVLVDVSNDDPKEVGRWSMVEYDSKWSEVDSWVRTLHDVWVHDGRAYLAQWDAGVWVVDVSNPRRPTHVAHFGGRPLEKLAEIPSSDERDAVVGLPGNAHFVMTNEDASLLACNKEAWDTDGSKRTGPGGIDLWDISTIERPRKLTTIDPPKTSDPSYDVSPLSSIVAVLSPVGTASAHGCHECGEVSSSGQWTTSHNFDFVGDRLYTSWYNGGVKVFDVSDPSNPAELVWWRKPNETAFWSAEYVSDTVFVGGSMGGDGDGRGGIYTFPNYTGEQKSSPPLTNGNTATTTVSNEQKDDVAATTGQPGFGVGVAGLSVLGFSLWARRRQNED